jgi:hypothetical protein
MNKQEIKDFLIFALIILIIFFQIVLYRVIRKNEDTVNELTSKVSQITNIQNDMWKEQAMFNKEQNNNIEKIIKEL